MGCYDVYCRIIRCQVPDLQPTKYGATPLHNVLTVFRRVVSPNSASLLDLHTPAFHSYRVHIPNDNSDIDKYHPTCLIRQSAKQFDSHSHIRRPQSEQSKHSQPQMSASEPEQGATATAQLVVGVNDLASALPIDARDAFPAVFATARLVALMEIASAPAQPSPRRRPAFCWSESGRHALGTHAAGGLGDGNVTVPGPQ
jgi:hypothetical protein